MCVFKNLSLYISLIWCLFGNGAQMLFCDDFLALDYPEKPMVIVVPSYNNIQWYQKNLESLLSQKYGNYRILYVNDGSLDGTGEAVEQFLIENGVDYRAVYFDNEGVEDIPTATGKLSRLVNEEPHFFTLINNISRVGALANLYRMITSCQDKEIIATVDGDDWFYHDAVLKDLNDAYSSGEVWFTYGKFILHPNGKIDLPYLAPIPAGIVSQNAFRAYIHPSHLRTFYAWLFKKIPLEDLLYNGDFFPMAWDMAIMYPIAEMAGERHAFMEKVNYVYNISNPINDNKVNAQLQRDLDHYIRNKPRYQRLEKGEMQ